MRVLFCGGGTAGHVMPALAISKILKDKFRNVESAFVGRVGGSENRSIIKEGEKLYTVDVQGFRHSLSPKNASSILKLIKSFGKARKIIRDFKPDIIIGTGGYVCYPIIKVGQKMGIKTVIHESNVYPGLVTRLLAAKCDSVLMGSEETRRYLKPETNAEWVGNPVRQSFKATSREEARSKLGIGKNEFFIVSFGGSLGAQIINEAVGELMRSYSMHTLNVSHLHSVGTANYDEVKKRFPKLCSGKGKCKIVPYIDDMPTVLKAADLAITRSGAMTVSELGASEIASILIPSPNVTANHQYLNAKHLCDIGAAIMIEEKNLSADRLLEAVKKIRCDRRLRDAMRQKIAAFSPNNVDTKISEAIEKLL